MVYKEIYSFDEIERMKCFCKGNGICLLVMVKKYCVRALLSSWIFKVILIRHNHNNHYHYSHHDNHHDRPEHDVRFRILQIPHMPLFNFFRSIIPAIQLGVSRKWTNQKRLILRSFLSRMFSSL